jgi:hypothetical protein
MIHPKPLKITFEMNEHDALLVLNLVRKEATLSPKVWTPYWDNLAHNIQTCIEQAGPTQGAEDSSTQFRPWLITLEEEQGLKEESFYSTDIITSNPQTFYNFIYSITAGTYD